MKKLVLLMPLFVAPTLIGCNKPIYLELWSKEINYIDENINTITTRKFEGKQCVEIVTDEYDGDDIYISTTETFTYNDHGDILRRVMRKRYASEEIEFTINDFTYDYRDDGLINQKKIEIVNSSGAYTAVYTYEYDDLKRLTHEVGKLEDEIKYESISRYYTKFNTYSYNKTWDFFDPDDRDYWVTTENTINEAGDITQSIVNYERKELTNRASKTRFIYTYDEHHCPVHMEEEFYISPNDWQLQFITDSTFHKNNPQKILNSITKMTNMRTRSSDTYTYDEYDRKTSCVHNGVSTEPVVKTTWEYDQVIPA